MVLPEKAWLPLSTNASEGLWMASPKKTALQNARIVLVFESAYDAMAFYQLQMRKESGLDQRGRQDLESRSPCLYWR